MHREGPNTGHGLVGLAPRERPEDTGPQPPPDSEFSVVKNVDGRRLMEARDAEGRTWWQVKERQQVQGQMAPVTLTGPRQDRVRMDDAGNWTTPAGKTPAQQRAEDAVANAQDAGLSDAQAAQVGQKAAQVSRQETGAASGAAAGGGLAVKVLAVALPLAAVWWFSS